jgi:hypothetical protein
VPELDDVPGVVERDEGVVRHPAVRGEEEQRAEQAAARGHEERAGPPPPAAAAFRGRCVVDQGRQVAHGARVGGLEPGRHGLGSVRHGMFGGHITTAGYASR